MSAVRFTIPLKDLILDPKNPVDVTTLSADQIRAKIQAAYSRLGDAVRVDVGTDSVTIEFPEDEGRQSEVEATFDRAVAKAEQGQVAEAIALHRQVIQQLPSHVPSRRNLALLLLERGDTDEATDLLLDLVLLDPDDPWAFGLLGKQYAARDENTTAEAYLRKALTLDPADSHSLINLAGVLVAQGRADEAEPLFLQVTEQSPELPNAYYGLAMVLVEKRAADAREQLDRMFDRTDFSDRKHHELLTDARKMYLGLCAQAGEDESSALWAWVKNQHLQVTMNTGWKIDIAADNKLGSTTAKLIERGKGNYQIAYNPSSDLLAPAMIARELERLLIRHEHPGALDRIPVEKQSTALEQSIVDYARELPETRFADIRLARRLGRLPPGCFIDIYLRVNEENQAAERIAGMKGFPPRLLDLWRFCAAFSAFSADILCRPRTVYGTDWGKLPSAPLARELAEELCAEGVDYPGFVGRFADQI